MQLGIFAKTFPRATLDETLDAVAGTGLAHVQFNMSCAGLTTLPDRLEEDRCIDIARSLRDRGLTMAAISGTFNMCDPDESRLEANLRRLEVIAAACRWLDTRIITLCTGTRDATDMWRWHPENIRRSSWSVLVESMRRAVKIADRHEVTLAFEPEMHNVVNSVCKARRLLDEIASPWLKVVIDPCNLPPPDGLERIPEFFDEAFDWLGPDLVLAHAKNLHPEFKIQSFGEPAFLEYLKAEFGISAPPASAAPSEAIDPGMLGVLQKLARPLRLYIASLGPGRRERIEQGEIEPVELAHRLVFFIPYFRGLLKASYKGPVIIHGIAENAVSKALSYLVPAAQIAEEFPKG
jgi:sugar phosphate isomerase/epimerase